MEKESKEEYLEALYKLTLKNEGENIKTGEIAEKLGVSPPTVTEVLPKLEDDGLIRYYPYHGVEITEEGKDIGKDIVRAHRVLEVFLKQFFSLDDERLHEKACEMEHIFDMEMIDEMCERLGAPKRCPHGKTIPSCGKEICPLEGDGD